LLQNQYDITCLTLGMSLHHFRKLKIQFFADIQQIWKKMQTNCILSPLTLQFIHKFLYFRCLYSEFFHILIANKIFHVTVLLLVYFCDQFVAPEIRHSRCHCSVCQQSIWYLVTRTRFDKNT